jgi:uncharacterized Ntn-hydrolase superfamily protein
MIGRCPRTESVGIGVATFSLAVGGSCPFFKVGVAAMASQAYGNPRLSPIAIRLMAEGGTPSEALAELGAHDEFIEYRQLGAVAVDGAAAARTGSRVRPWCGDVVGDGFVAMGNGLKDQGVLDAMAGAFTESAGEGLDERLVRALEAGRDAGGQHPPGGQHRTERSAAVVVYGADDWALLNLRVDLHEKAVDELRRVLTEYRPYIPYYRQRAANPPELPAQADFAARLAAESAG